MVLMSLFDPHVILGLVESEKATVALGVPTMILAMLDAYDANPRDVSSLELVCSGGAMVAPELVRRVHRTLGCAYSTVYGQTEHSPLITQHHSDDSIDDICNTVGQPIPQTEVSIPARCRQLDRRHRRDRRNLRPRAERHAGLSRQRRGDGRGHWTPMAGSTQATSGVWTRAATSRSPAG